jgi:hypothetical protein
MSRLQCLNIAPSWSWASVPGEISYERDVSESSSKSWVELEHVWISLAQADNPYGNLKEGALQLHARLCSMHLPTDGRSGVVCRINNDLPADNRLTCWIFYWDELQDQSIPERIYTVVPLWMKYDSRSMSSHYEGLVVSLLPSTVEGNTSNSCRVYRRIGFMATTIRWGSRSTINSYESSSEEGKTVYVPPDSQSVFDALFPNAALQTIVIK